VIDVVGGRGPSRRLRRSLVQEISAHLVQVRGKHAIGINQAQLLQCIHDQLSRFFVHDDIARHQLKNSWGRLLSKSSQGFDGFKDEKLSFFVVSQNEALK
jgi:hypothetical protein